MNSKYSKKSDPDRLLLNLANRIDLRKDKYTALSNLPFTIHGQIYKRFVGIINSKCQLQHLMKKLEYLMDHFGIRYSRQYEAVTDNPSIRIYINKIEDRITIKIKRGHSKSMFAQDSRVLTPSPLVCPCSFLGTPPSPARYVCFG